MWSSIKFLPVFLLWWNFCHHPGLSALELSVLFREYWRTMSIPDVPASNRVTRKNEMLKFRKTCYWQRFRRRDVSVLVLLVEDEEAQNVEYFCSEHATPSALWSCSTAPSHVPCQSCTECLGLEMPAGSFCSCQRPYFHSNCSWVSLWLLFCRLLLFSFISHNF